MRKRRRIYSRGGPYSQTEQSAWSRQCQASDEVLFCDKLFPAELPIQATLTRTEKEIPGFETHCVSLPWAPGGPFTLWGKRADAAWIRSPHGSQVAFDSSDAHLLSTNDITRAGWWQQTEDTFKPLHFGNFGGIPSKIFWSLGGLTPAMLCLSGMSIWWQRQRRVGRSQYRSTPSL